MTLLRSRVARQYAPLLLTSLMVLLVAITVDPRPPAPAARVATGLPDSIVTQDGVAAGPGQQASADKVVQGGGGPQGVVTACGDRQRQVPGDPYSPPCIEFSGDNGGKTSHGVTEDEIVISVRQLDIPNASQAFADLSGDIPAEDPESIYDTVDAYIDYFNSKFQFYGRKLKLKYFEGKGNITSELLGSGREAALADAVTARNTVGAFAELNGLSLVYADALARQGVISFGAPYPSRQWFQARRPYVWSFFPDGTNVVETASSWMSARMGPSSNAQYAGPSLRGKPRRFGILAPENEEYQESVRAFLARMDDLGIEIADVVKYQLDLGSMSNQASSIVARFKDRGITSVIAACDPVMLALGLLPKSNEQGYEPEWITFGLAFVDLDLVGQIMDDAQWKRAFGIAYNAEPEPLTRSYAYAAFKQMRPNDEPSFVFQEVYYQIYSMVIGIQMAGPDLTPETFEAGMFAYPSSSGPRGLWGFGPGDYTTTDDYREVWWDPTATSTQNNKPGAWSELNGGARYSVGTPPKGSAPYFNGAPP